MARHAGGVSLGLTHYAAGSLCGLHAHEHARLVLVLRGGFAERYGRLSRRATPYLAIYRPPRELHGERYGPDGATCISVALPADWLAGVAAAPAQAAELRAQHVSRCIDDLDDELAIWDGASPLAVEERVLELVVALAGAPAATAPGGGTPRWWRRAEELLLEEFRRPMSVSRLAAEVGVHPVHLARTFRRRTGRTLGATVRALRVDWARAELTRGDAPIAAIAAEAGFSDQSHLVRVMKRVAGRTPGAFRRQLRKRPR